MIRERYLDSKSSESEQIVKVVSLSYLTGTERARLDDLQTSKNLSGHVNHEFERSRRLTEPGF